MLLAGPSSSYSYASPRLSNISSRTSQSSKSTSNESIPISSASSRYSLMKSFAVHLNRGTELLKQTVQRAILKAPSPNKDLNTVAPTKYHIVPDLDRASTDSLDVELCHFRPIRPCSVTPSTSRRFLKLPKIPKAIKVSPRGKEKTFPAIHIGRKPVVLAKNGSAFCALCPANSPEDTAAFKAPKNTTKTRANRKRKLTEDEEGSPAPKVARVTRSTARKCPIREEEKPIDHPVRRTRANGRIHNAQRADIEEQERRDYELAKKLQDEINYTPERSRNSTASTASGYSLRSKRKSSERNTEPPRRRTTKRTKKTI
ncbi:hypothetical protein DMENIID0001_150480 [Sergentomyia squamirostris]